MTEMINSICFTDIVDPAKTPKKNLIATEKFW